VKCRNGVDSFQSAACRDEVRAVGAIALDVKRTVRMSVFDDRNETGPVPRQVVGRHPLASLHTATASRSASIQMRLWFRFQLTEQNFKPKLRFGL